jgi:RNA polymerase sigma-70 factor, ECF subfamily
MDAALDRGYWISMDEKSGQEIIDADAQLMLQFKGGDLAAFDRLFSRHTRSVISFAYRFVRNRQIAEELAQEVFMRVYEGAAAYQPRAKFTTWLYRIATNVCLNEIRKPQMRAECRRMSSDAPVGPDIPDSDFHAGNTPDKVLERQAISHAIQDALEQLPDKQRMAFILNKYQELSYVEVAEIMKTSETAVKSLIHRAKEALAERLRLLLPELFGK